MKSIGNIINEKPWVGWVLFFGTIIIVFMLGLLASSIIERRAEAVFAYTPEVEHEEWDPRAEVWGMNYPRQYETYLQTADTTFTSKYYGAAKIDVLANAPELVVLWAGYAFSLEYNQGRGHMHAIDDIWNILRTGAPMTPEDGPQPGTCWACKSPDVPRLMNQMGIAEFYSSTFAELGPEIVNPIGCADCHDAKTMQLQITRPGLVEAFERQGKDVSKSTHQEMRSLVCAQCHVEYYFKGDGKYLTFPWDKGFKMEDMEAYYGEINFADWTHHLSRTPMIKAQHPDYELFRLGVHFDRGVACADCHMPYKNQGGVKFTNHHIQSPLNNVANTCAVCHREETEKMIQNVYQRQDAIYQTRSLLEEVLAKAHLEAKFAWDKGANQKQMENALKLIRGAQWRWDFVAASHGASFHAPFESGRIIGLGLEKAQEARIEIARVMASMGYSNPIPLPDISTKEKAQEVIGVDIKRLNAEKKVFLNTVIPQWIKIADEREATYPTKNL
ncbi:MAG: ammonia-forming cytochrome c nitrite reductase [Bacteroidales bacterium]|nr:ammonia-forming cytochrome c nitrite reductase [Bacteroidales bacterium]MDD4673111.1 ammonia-forming cytochrome c nitrite reductase [Bacteroidales bacterium]MDY0348455.1 ammonia-forming cytochrome c nitrite reductase [Tenuifilaceae bacterium]